MSSSKPSSAPVSVPGPSTARSAKAGTAWSVTAVTTPSAPSPMRAAENTSGRRFASQSSTAPSGVTNCRPRTWVARPPNRAPVPWVPVEKAPATVCRSMSPRFVSDQPRRTSSAFSRCSGTPGPTVIRPSSLTSPIPASAPHASWMSSGRPMPVNECPLPMGRTRRPAAAAAVRTPATSSAEAGCTISASARSLPAQLRHRVRFPGGAGASVTQASFVGLRSPGVGTLLPRSAQVNGWAGVDRSRGCAARCGLMSLPQPDADRARARLDGATADLDPPLAILDLDALDANAADLVRRAAGKPIRVASKSVRNRGVLRRVLARPGFAGVLAYSLPEALWLSGGDDPVTTDVVVGYPSADRSALRQMVADDAAAARVTLMVDSIEQLDLVDDVVPPGHRAPVRICLDVDASLRVAGGRV